MAQPSRPTRFRSNRLASRTNPDSFIFPLIFDARARAHYENCEKIPVKSRESGKWD
jgi:hypothetical protein